jgi:hypothetical protein
MQAGSSRALLEGVDIQVGLPGAPGAPGAGRTGGAPAAPGVALAVYPQP